MFKKFFPASATQKLEKPLRAEIFSRDALAHHGAEIADRHTHCKRRVPGAKLHRRFKDNYQLLEEAYFAFAESAKSKEVLTAGAEWLLDNYHVIEEQVRDIRRDLPHDYYRELPKVIEGNWAGFPRVYHLVCEFVSHTDSLVDQDLLTAFIESYQTRVVLEIGEVWAVPIMLRMALVENLRRLAEASLKTREAKRITEKFCSETLDVAGTSGSDMMVNLAARLKLEPSMVELGAVHILRRLRAKGAPASLALQWFDAQLREQGLDPNELTRLEQTNQAADQISVGNCITALKSLGSINWREWFEKVSRIDQILRKDPAKIYQQCDFTTRDLYRHKIEYLSRHNERSEIEVAEELIDFATTTYREDEEKDERYQHVGYFLIDDGREEFEKRLKLAPSFITNSQRFLKNHAFTCYGLAILSLISAILIFVFLYGKRLGVSKEWLYVFLCLLALPASEWSIQVVQWVLTKFVGPKPLPKLDFELEVPETCRTVVAVQTILNDKETVERIIESLEIRYIGNEDPCISFAILADLPDATCEVLPGDRGIINHATRLIEELNTRFATQQNPNAQKFFLLFRKRLWNESEQKFIGYERKRGKIMEFNRLLRGASDTTFNIIIGDIQELKKVRYVITLDTDTQLPAGIAKKLIGTLAHPLNRAIFDKRREVVVKGYGIIQPRVDITLQSGNASLFAWLFSGHSGLDPYTHTVSDVYQDVFGEGSYIGKGIYEVDIFKRALEGRAPDNKLLSHDLFEGSFARTAIASDIELFDEFPAKYHTYAKRQHRWIRGDWQLLAWVFGRVPQQDNNKVKNPLSSLNRWKLFDNLRRSLIATSFLLCLVWVWHGEAKVSCLWFTILLIMFCFPIYGLIIGTLIDIPIGYSLSNYFRGMLVDLKKTILQVSFNIILLPHQTYIACHAIIHTLYRIFISKHHFLEWETAYAAEKRLAHDFKSFLSEMSLGLYALLPATFLLFYFPKSQLWLGLPLLVAWYTSPVFLWWAGNKKRYEQQKLSFSEEIYLQEVAYSTWKYFDTYLKPEYNYLIPDNLQVVPKQVVAERTSPTNISLSTLGIISAYDLGFVPLPGALTRLKNVFESLSKLERFHGHFLNWYEIRELRSLSPRYVSSVDSGNLVGHFIAVKEALKQFIYSPLIDYKHRTHLDALLGGISNGSSEDGDQNERRGSSHLSFRECTLLLNQLRKFDISEAIEDERARTILEFGSLEKLIKWVEFLPFIERVSEKANLPKRLWRITKVVEGRAPSLSLILKLTNRLLKLEEVFDKQVLNDKEREELATLRSYLIAAQEEVHTLVNAINTVHHAITQIVNEMDFKFLFDSKKKILTIGYNIDRGQKDNSYYDLLASEARLASLVGIAKGDLPESHWFVLGRGLTDSLGGKALLSWSATMFEYLMPLLVTKDFPGTLLSGTYKSVVKTQQLYAKKRKVPWGMSESAYSGVDFEKTYQYRAFGIPGLGLKRGLGEDVVVSPYSSFLSISIAPKEVVENIRRLERIGARGEFGFYEAIDFTQERLSDEETSHVVKSFLAHHQGMSLVAINNFLNNDIFPERFHSSPIIRATELLLQERFPRKIPVIIPHQAELSFLEREENEAKAQRSESIRTPHTHFPRVRILSNGKLTTFLDNSGGGGLFYQGDISLIRWREDGLKNQSGLFIYLRDRSSRQFWSVGYQPARVEPEEYEVLFNPEKVELKRKDFGIATHTEITISPEDNVEIRKVTLSNLSGKVREIEVTSYGEIALAPHRADLAHPAFSKMFVESEFIEEYDALIFSRRPRSAKDPRWYILHMVTMPVVWEPVQFETARQNFLGRGRGASNPIALTGSAKLSRTQGTVLDPVAALRAKVELDPGDSQSVNFVTAVAQSKDEILNLARRYRETQPVLRAFEMAWSQSDVEIRHQQFTITQVHAFQHLANVLLYNIVELRASAEMLRKNHLPQSALWRLGISGDEPIALLVLSDPEQLKVAQEALLAHEYLRLRGIRFDLVLLNEYPGGYMQHFQEELEFLMRAGYSRDHVDKRGGVFLRTAGQISEEELWLLHTVSRVVLYGNKGSLATQLKFEVKQEAGIISRGNKETIKAPAFKPPAITVEYENNVGGFVEGGKAYRMVVDTKKPPPQPWSNVVANKKFGFLVSEAGAGYTWSDNCRENRLTPWNNDPVSDPHGEVLYLRDVESGEYWCPTSRPVDHGEVVEVKHGFGYSEFNTQVKGVFTKLTLSTTVDEPLKIWNLEVSNGDVQEKKLEVFLYVEWVLGVSREEAYRYIQTSYETESQILYAQNPFIIDFSRQMAFIGATQDIQSYTSDRKEFLGRHGDLGSPTALERARTTPNLGQLLTGARGASMILSRSVGAGFDSCGVIKVQISVAPGEKRQIGFFLGKANSINEAKQLATKYRSARNCVTALKEVKEHWKSILETVQVSTPDRAFDLLVNGWLLYQTLSCRMLARTGLYQSSGAMGFRDQLQDSMALLYARPQITRDQILLHASRQFFEGDVQHWWHPPSGKGIRTKMSDSYLWLPYAVYDYLQITGDNEILEEKVSFLEGPHLEPDEMESYNTPWASQHQGTLYEHCVIALDRSMATGSHGLSLIWAGDWNDGFNQVGVKGKGESVWLSWFIADILSKFATIVETRKDSYRATEYRKKAKELVEAIEANAWDGDWYRRAYFDDGTPLGSANNAECKIDSLAQSWSVITGLGEKSRQRMSMENAYKHLVKLDSKIICLLWPPFDKSDPSPGYIQGYCPGLRENGGQYTHAAAWFVMAAALMGDGTRASELFSFINPINHTLDAKGVARYQTEPYVTCGDVYSTPPHEGRGGWSWYTGSSGWLYRVALEHILGFKIRGDGFYVDPCIPKHWKGFELKLKRGKVTYIVEVENPGSVEKGVKEVVGEGVEVREGKVIFVSEGDRAGGTEGEEREIRVRVTLGQ